MLLGCSAIGVYYTVPDTELPLVLMGCCVPLVLLSVPWPYASLGTAGSAVTAAVFTWVIMIGGRGRPGSVVAGVATLGLLLILPVARWALGPGRRRFLGMRLAAAPTAALAALGQLALGAWCGKVAGPQQSAPVAAALLILPLGLLGAAGNDLLRPRAHRERHRVRRRGTGSVRTGPAVRHRGRRKRRNLPSSRRGV
jgi:hypothetical protein